MEKHRADGHRFAVAATLIAFLFEGCVGLGGGSVKSVTTANFSAAQNADQGPASMPPSSPKPSSSPIPTPSPITLNGTPDVAQPGQAIPSLGQVVSLNRTALNGAVLAPNFVSVGVVSYATTPTQPSYSPVAGLKKVAPGEYNNGLLMENGDLYMPNPSTNAVLLKTNPTGVAIADVACGLHQCVASDTTGHAWDYAPPDSGSGGPSGPTPYSPAAVPTDASGAAFDHVTAVMAGDMVNVGSFNAALKSDGSLWFWGNTTLGVSGDGTGGKTLTLPTKVSSFLPNGVTIKKVVLSNYVLVLASDGTVWSWGEDGTYLFNQRIGRTGSGAVPGQVQNLPPNIADIANGGEFSYALTTDGQLYAWGYAEKFGIGMDWSPVYPMPISTALNLPSAVQSIICNQETTHVILTDGSMWGWGDDAMGEVGDGQELDYSKSNFAWDWNRDDLLVKRPVHIAPQVSNFKRMYTNATAAFYLFAQTEDGYLYAWGRNKTPMLFNGIISASPNSSNISATYPNSWDVLVPMKVNPFQLQKNTEVTSTYCLMNPASTGPCTEFNIATGKAYYEQ